MTDFEKLGAFYLGKRYDLAAGKRSDDLVLYDSKDLTTHGVIIGMTGSGKTGLGIGLLEEALIDNIPVIAIDPKGDLPNLLLSFPDLRPGDFRPWINPQDAANAGQTEEEFAAAQAALWKKGLSSWGQESDRIRKLRESVEFRVYTPGSSSGRPLSILRSFNAPPQAVRDDGDLWAETVRATATGLLTLLGMNADPLTSREHILLANILEANWREGRNLDLAALIGAIRKPPFERLGVLDLESFYPAKDRTDLAMRLNNLLASPGFGAWMEGDPLDIARMLRSDDSKTVASVISIAHLPDQQRMFFMTLLLNRVMGWMRTQSGTTSLRAILYIDEVFGYLPPSANPPTKTPLLTLFKQARAYGLGVVLATQNPVDLDYKALSNAGTWFLGRLQTERDKMRVLEGLEGAAAGGSFDRARMEQTLAGLGKRVFLLHNVHEAEPVTFETRWVMSYLRGPMTRDDIRRLHETGLASGAADSPAAAAPADERAVPDEAASVAPPPSPASVETWYLEPSGAGTDVEYRPAALGLVEAHYSNSRHSVNEERRWLLVTEPGDGPDTVEWSDSLELDVDWSKLAGEAPAGARFQALPDTMMRERSWSGWQKDLERHVRQDRPLILYRCRDPKETSRVGERRADFEQRLAQLAREARDLEIAKLRTQYESKAAVLRERVERARDALEKQSGQVRSATIDAVTSIGATILGAFLGRKAVSVSGATRAGTAVRRTTRIGREKQDVEAAEGKLARAEEAKSKLEERFESDLAKLESVPTQFEIEEVVVRATSRDITTDAFGLVWLPWRRNEAGAWRADFPVKT